MNKALRTIYSGYRDIKLIAKDIRTLPHIKSRTLVGSASYMPHLLGLDNSADLLIIDLDAFGVERTRCLIFLANCFIPNTPIVLQAENSLPRDVRNELMRTGNVLDIIESRDSASLSQVC